MQRLAPAGFAIESAPSAGGATRVALAFAPSEATDGTGVVTTYGEDLGALRKGMSALRRLSRLEWAERDEPSPLADNEASALLEDVALELGKQGKVRLARLDDAAGEAIAAALVVDDGDRAVVLAMAVDPQVSTRGARLLHAEAIAARQRGCIALDVVIGASEYAMPTLPTSKQHALAVRVWGHSAAAQVGRTYSSVARRRAARPRDAVGRGGPGARRVDEDPQRRREHGAVRPLRAVPRPAVDARHRAALRPRDSVRSPKPSTTSSTRRHAPSSTSSSRSTS